MGGKFTTPSKQYHAKPRVMGGILSNDEEPKAKEQHVPPLKKLVKDMLDDPTCDENDRDYLRNEGLLRKGEGAGYKGFRIGDAVIRKGERCTLSDINFSTEPPSAILRM